MELFGSKDISETWRGRIAEHIRREFGKGVAAVCAINLALGLNLWEDYRSSEIAKCVKSR